MMKKIIGYYSDIVDTVPETGQLVLEIGEQDIACLVKGNTDDPIDGFELFSTEGRTDSWEKIVAELLSASRLLNATYSETLCYYNCEEAMIIPAEKFTDAGGEDYMSLVFGQKYNYDTRFDFLKNGLINGYRVPTSLHEAVTSHFLLHQSKHSFSKLLDGLLVRENLPVYFVKLQVYSRHAICCLMKEGKLQLIRYFPYQSTQDLFYFLTSLLQQFPVTKANAALELSGMLPADHGLFAKLFEEIRYDEAFEANHPITQALTGFPLYYFTPFLKLAL